MNLIFSELYRFSKQNWWIFILFLICLTVIYVTNSGNLLEISLVFVAHFLGDLAVMLMGDYFSLYHKTKNKKYEKYALIAQTVSFFIFGLIGLYAGLVWGKWAYFVPQILFIWPLLKEFGRLYKIQVLEKINYRVVLTIGLLTILGYFYFGLIHNIGGFIQVLGFVVFPLGLSIKNSKLRYVVSTIGIGFIFIGSLYQLVVGILEKSVSGVDVSYTLLPFAVFIFYLKNLHKFLKE